MSRASEARPGTQGDTTARFNCPSILPLGPGSRIFAPLRARSSGTRGAMRARYARGAHNEPLRRRRISRCQTAQCCSFPRRVVAPGFSSFSFAPDPKRGGRSADRRTCSVVAFARRDGSARVRRGASHDAGRSPLGAPPWRFSAGGRASISGIASGSVQRAPRSQVIMPGGRCPGPPEPAVTSRGRRTPLPAPPSGSSPETPLHERGWQKVLYIRYVVK